jgi:hypothetical protein
MLRREAEGSIADFAAGQKDEDSRHAKVIIPADGGRGFQGNVDVDSRGTWTGFWLDRVQFWQ